MGITIQSKKAWVTETSDQYDERIERERSKREEEERKRREKYRLKKIEEERVEREKLWEEGREERERQDEERKKQEKAFRLQVQAKRDKEDEIEAYKENEYRKNREKLDKKLSKEYKELISKNINTSSLNNKRLTYAEREEITEFGKLCAGTQLPELKRKFVKVNKYITDHNLWDRFPTIRAKLTFSGGSNHKGISAKHYRTTMELLGSETCDTGEHVISSESF